MEELYKFYICSSAYRTFVRALARAGLELPSSYTRYELICATETNLSEAYNFSIINPTARVDPRPVLLDVLTFGAETRLQLDLLDDITFAKLMNGK